MTHSPPDADDPGRDVAETIKAIEESQRSLLLDASSILEQIASTNALLLRLIELVTPVKQEGPALSDILKTLIDQQTAILVILRRTFEVVTRLDGHFEDKGAPC